MNRRDTLQVLATIAGTVGAPNALAQPGLARVGVIFARPRNSKDLQAFFAELSRLGFTEGTNLQIDYLQSDVEKFPEAAAELVRRKVNLIYAPSTAAAVAAKGATSATPIVFATAHDPVEVGLVDSLARPGGNVTGMTVFASELPGKRLQLLRDVRPGLSRVAVLRSPLTVQNAPAWNALAAAALALRLLLEPFDLQTAAQLEQTFRAIRSWQAQGLLIHDDAFTSTLWAPVAALAINSRLPSNSTWDTAAEAGLLFSYGPNIVTNYQKAAGFVAAILKGRPPADLPVEQPLQFELVLNLKTARALGVVVPREFLLLTDRLIEA